MSATLPRIGTLDYRAREDAVPVNVLFELTHLCNLRCFHCYVDPDPAPRLSTDEVFGILDQLAEAGTLFVTFTGGEIMRRDDLYEVMAHARDKHFAVRLFTNGTLIDEEAADRIAELSPVDVGISIYGSRAETHEAVTRVHGSFEASINAIRLLTARGVLTRTKTVLMDTNIAEHQAIAELAENLGVPAQFDPHLTPRNNGDESALEHSLSEDQVANVVEVERLDTVLPADTALCAAGRDSADISPSGKVLPCVQMPMPIGDLRKQSFAEIWNGPAARKMRSLTLGAMRACPSCPDLGYCSPCLGLNLIETGDPTTPSSSVCRMARARRKEGAIA